MNSSKSVSEAHLVAQVRRRLAPFVGLGGAEGAARLLSFLFYLLAARALAPEGFGVVRYTITLGLLALAPMQVLGTAVQREAGALGRGTGYPQLLGTGLAFGGLIWAATIGCVGLAAVLGWTGSADVLGICLVMTGTAVFQFYYAISRGLGDIRRAAMSYVGASGLQLAAFAGYIALGHVSTGVSLAIFATSSVVAVLACEMWEPVVRRARARFSRQTAKELVALGMPLAGAQLGFLLWQSADQVWVEQTLSNHQVGLYAAAKNLAQLFIVLPAAVSGVVMPRVARLHRAGDHKSALRLANRAALASFALTLVPAVIVGAFAPDLLRVAFGADYEGGGAPLALLAVSMLLYAPFSALASAAVGWGQPGVYSVGACVAAGVQVLLLLLVPAHSASWAAACTAVGMGAGLVGLIVALCTQRGSIARRT